VRDNCCHHCTDTDKTACTDFLLVLNSKMILPLMWVLIVTHHSEGTKFYDLIQTKQKIDKIQKGI
jgi:hypothetical protein